MPRTRLQASRSHVVVLKYRGPYERPVAKAGLPINGKAASKPVGGKAIPKPQKACSKKVQVDTAFEENQALPKPCGQPKVWADERQALCETLPYYYKSWRSSTHTNDGIVGGLLLDKDRSQGGSIGAQVIICRVGGGFEILEDGTSAQVRDHDRAHANVACFEKSLSQKVPFIVILGHKCTYSPVAVPHRYCVLDFFYVTAFWPENREGHVLYRIRLEKRDLLELSWWVPEGSQAMPTAEDLNVKALTQVCASCGTESPQIYTEAWYCLDAECNPKGLLSNGSSLTSFTYHDAFLKSRAPQKLEIKPPFNLVRDLPEGDPMIQDQASGHGAWMGLRCPNCGRCNSRVEWDAWKCGGQGCGFVHPMKHTVLSYKTCISGEEFDGHALDSGFCIPKLVDDLGTDILGDYRLRSFALLPENFVTHIMANKTINDGPRGPNEMFHALQQAKLGLKRLELTSKALEVPKLSMHFAHNYGRKYEYCAKVKSTPFKDAPKVVTAAIGRLDWAARVVAKGSDFDGHNEVLLIGYFAEQGMGYHDDGEAGIGKVVVSLSLGGDAVMTWRLKKKYYQPTHMQLKNINKHDATMPVFKGSKFWKERDDFNQRVSTLDAAEYKIEKEKLYKAYKANRSVNCAPLITITLKHGDYMIMDGDQIQKYYEHQVKATGNKLRFALTARTINAVVHGVSAQDSEYQLDPEDVYNYDGK